MPDDLLTRARALPRPSGAPHDQQEEHVNETDDLLTRARTEADELEKRAGQGATADVIDELVAEVRRLRPLAELWGRLEVVVHERVMTVDVMDGVICLYSPGGRLLGSGVTLSEAVRALLDGLSE